MKAFLFLMVVASVCYGQANNANTYCTPTEVPSFGTDNGVPGPLSCNYTARAASPSPNGVKWTPTTASALTTALASAACGDIIQIPAGTAIQGNFTIANACNAQHWLTIQTSGIASFPPEGSRATPCYWGVASLPGRPFSCTSITKYGATVEGAGRANAHALTFSSGAQYIRLIGLELTVDPTTVLGDEPVYGIALMSAGNINHIVFDQTWGHGNSNNETEYFTNLGLGASGPTTHISFIDGFYSDFHCVSVIGQCAQAYAVAYGESNAQDGPFKFVDNFLEAAAENLFSGGGTATNTPADIEVRGNHLFKPLTWNPSSPTYNGGVCNTAVPPVCSPFIVENLLENKNVNREFIEGNVLQNNWAGFSQVGEAITLTPKNSFGDCPSCSTTNVIIRYNKIIDAAQTYQIANALDDTGHFPYAGGFYSLHDNLFDDIGDSLTCGSYTPTQCVNNAVPQLGGIYTDQSAVAGATWLIHDVTENHDTVIINAAPVVAPSSLMYIDGPNGALQTNLTITNNIVNAGSYGLGGAGSGVNGHCAYGQGSGNITAWLNLCWTGWVWTKNAIVNGGNFNWPTGNFIPAAYSAVGFTNYNGGNGGNYRLLSSSPYYNAATDGLDIGVSNWPLLNALTTAAVSGNNGSGGSGPSAPTGLMSTVQ